MRNLRGDRPAGGSLGQEALVLKRYYRAMDSDQAEADCSRFLFSPVTNLGSFGSVPL
jgi:hypothetical protein